ncbi:MAG: metallophosphoesterase [Clostridia bacterium]|nr:metallophosphoesterase [Clostridia bacterium]
MTYVVSNIHGDIAAWKELLKKIKFTGNDAMFVLGDIIDIGEDGLEILEEMSYAQNIWPVAGEHEAVARKLLGGFQELLKNGKAPDADYIAGMQKWMMDGGAVTLDSFRKLDEDMKEGLLEYLDDMPLYEEVTVGGKKYFLVHSGITGFDPSDEFDAYEEDEFFGDAPVRKIPGYTVICGHSPSADGNVFYGDGFVNIDCGAGRGGRLAALRLEDGREYYV